MFSKCMLKYDCVGEGIPDDPDWLRQAHTVLSAAVQRSSDPTTALNNRW
jgi:hypothetical protein